MSNRLSELLSEWRESIEKLARAHDAAWADAGLPDVFVENFWGSKVGAEKIAAAEDRLGLKLPADYVEFVSQHDGWPLPGFGYDGYFLEIGKVGKFRALAPDSFSALPSSVNGAVRRVPIAAPAAQPAWAADKTWLTESLLLTSDNFNNSTVVLLVPLSSGGKSWIEYWYESTRDGALRFDSLFALLVHLRDRLLKGIPYQIGIA